MFRSVSLCSCCLWLLLSGLAAAKEPAAAKVPEVTVCHPLAREVTDYEYCTGRTVAAQTAVLRPRVTGYLEAVYFKGGETVKQGDLLFKIDARMPQAAYDKAAAEVQLAEATLQLAKMNLAREQKLAATPGVISVQQLDQDKATANTAEAALRVARANLESAKLQLDFTRVTAPFTGRISLPEISVGNLVAADSTSLATIVSTDVVYVDFDVPEAVALYAPRLIAKGVSVDCELAGESGYPRKATIESASNVVSQPEVVKTEPNPVAAILGRGMNFGPSGIIASEPGPGALLVRALFNNADGRILPGMHAEARLTTRGPYKAVLVPEDSLQRPDGGRGRGGRGGFQALLSRKGWFVYVASGSNVIERRDVTVGAHEDDGLRVVESGLMPNDEVVVQWYSIEQGQTVKPKLIEPPRE